MKDRTQAEQPWSVPVVVADIPETGRQLSLAADAATRAAVAKAANVTALPRLEAHFELTRYGRDGVRVAGRVAATVGQNCVVTLEPMESAVEETIDVVFAPPQEPLQSRAGDTETAQAVDAEEPPEILRGGTIDLGAIAVEFVLLAIDPYPREPGAVFDAPAEPDDPASHPFAALAALKKGSTGGDGA
jgi:uncharacterized metal-binding protein YceD (DUF177 family)